MVFAHVFLFLLLVVPHLKLDSNDEISKDCAEDGGKGLFSNIKEPHGTETRSCFHKINHMAHFFCIFFALCSPADVNTCFLHLGNFFDSYQLTYFYT
jgi:hypothetical protein